MTVHTLPIDVTELIRVLSAATGALELLANPENWSSKDQGAILYGHFTAMEVAERALKKIRGEEVEP